MSNPNAAFGLRPVRHLKGGLIRTSEYTIADAYPTGLYIGDPVLCTGTGKNIGIAVGATNGVISGVFAGCHYVDVNGNTQWGAWPAAQVTKPGSVIVAEVYDDPDILFEIMSDATGLAAADIRQLANLIAGAGNDQTKNSGWYLTKPVAAENQVKVYGLSNCINAGGSPNAYGAYAVAEVLIAQHELNGTMSEI